MPIAPRKHEPVTRQGAATGRSRELTIDSVCFQTEKIGIFQQRYASKPVVHEKSRRPDRARHHSL